jgi:hypothetical protein
MAALPIRPRLLDALDLLHSLTFNPANHKVALAKLEGILVEVALGEPGEGRATLDAFLASQEGFETNSRSNQKLC